LWSVVAAETNKRVGWNGLKRGLFKLSGDGLPSCGSLLPIAFLVHPTSSSATERNWFWVFGGSPYGVTAGCWVVKIGEPDFVGGSFEVGTNVGVRKTSAIALFTGNTK